MTIGSEFNARSLPASEIASHFVPPEAHFRPLIQRSHSILIGPRGSGKTTLLKMLTLPALAEWVDPDADSFLSKIKFNAVLIPADRLWGEQLNNLSKQYNDPQFPERVFVAHTLLSFLRALNEIIDLTKNGLPTALAHLAMDFTPESESKFVKIVESALEVKPQINSVLGMMLSLQLLLAKTSELTENSNFEIDKLPALLSLFVSSANELSGQRNRKWALLFDELEIAPERIRRTLISLMRSTDERIILKLALAPFMPDLGLSESPDSPRVKHDYTVIPLTYANKEDAKSFTTKLANRIFDLPSSDETSLAKIFGEPAYRVEMTKHSPLPAEFLSLARKDESFARYLKVHDYGGRSFEDENERAQYIRKIAPIVKARDYYLSSYRAGRATKRRSRKTHTLYSGYPTILEVADGNPRAILTMLTDLAEDWNSRRARKKSKQQPVSIESQAAAVRKAEFLLASLLNVIPLNIASFRVHKGLLEFVDIIGRGFERRLLLEEFTSDYVGTFNVDENVSEATVNAIGQAVNVGALVFVPHSDASPDGILKGIRGMRFRLSFALSGRYHIPVTLGTSVNLSNLLRDRKDLSGLLIQASLFDEE